MSSLFRILAVLGLLGLGLVVFRSGEEREDASSRDVGQERALAADGRTEHLAVTRPDPAVTPMTPVLARTVSSATPVEPAPGFDGVDAERLVVRCVDERGEAIPDARVACFPVQGASWAATVREGVRDASGVFVFEELEAGRELELAARAPGFRPGRAKSRVGERPRIVLKRAVPYEGIVRRRGDETPLAGVRLRLVPQDLPLERELRAWLFDGEAVIECATDAGGHFSAEALAHGDRFHVHATHPECLPADWTEDLSFGVQKEVSLTPATPWWFRVVDAHSGEPIEGASLFAGPHWYHLDVVRTDPEGLAAFPVRLPPGEGPGRACRLTAPGYVEVAFHPDTADRASGPTPLRMVRGATIEGTVRTPDGEPLAGARVMLQGQGGLAPPSDLPAYQEWARPNGWPHGRTDENGDYRIEGVGPYQAASFLWASHPDHGESPKLTIQVPGAGKSTRHDLVMDVAGRIEGTVTFGGIAGRAQVAWRGPTTGGVLETDGRGRFRITGAAAGDWRFLPLSIERVRGRDDHRPLLEAAEPVRLELGASEELVLEVYPEGAARLAGVVRFENGKAAPEVSIWTSRKGADPRQTFAARTDVDGAFAFFVPTDGASVYRLTYGQLGSGSAENELVVPYEPRSYRLPTPGRLGVRLLDSRTGAVLPLAELEWRRLDSESKFWRKADDLWIGGDDRAWATLPAGWVDLPVRTSGISYFTCEQLEVAVRGDADEPIDLTLERGIRLVLRFQSPEGEWESPLREPMLVSEDGKATRGDYQGLAFGRTYGLLRPGRHRLADLEPGFGTRNPSTDEAFAFEPAEIVLGDDLEPVIDVRWRITDLEAYARLQEELREQQELIRQLDEAGLLCPDY